jgi:membrane fusion protein (multidrug efflux system)
VARDDATTIERTTATAPHAAIARPSFADRLRPWRWPLMIGGPLILLAVAGYFVIVSGRSQSTDDAYVQDNRVPVSASIGGRVTEVDVVDNQPVKAGQTLFKIDVRDQSSAEQAAEAQVAAARLQVEALRAGYLQAQDQVKTAQETAAFDQREVARQRALMQAGVASRDQYETAVHNADVAKQNVTTAQEAAARALADLGGADMTPDNHPSVLQAEAALARAKLNLSYGVIVAPQDGVVTRVEQLQVGSYVNPAQTLFWLVSGEPWIDANFKENQLSKMRIGQPATIHIDACAGDDFAGHVRSFSPGAGEAFSPLPAQNATGNWVKVVQRLPVQIAFNKSPPAKCGAAGLSANVTVSVVSPASRQQP